MIPEATFLFSVAGLSASLAGLAGLVAALRRGTEIRPVDLFRLRQIVEFAFANMLLALATIPVAAQLGAPDAIRLGATVGLVYGTATGAVHLRRMRAFGIGWTAGKRVTVGLIDLVLLVLGIWAVISGSMIVWQMVLIGLLARPMLAFLFVLDSFER